MLLVTPCGWRPRRLSEGYCEKQALFVGQEVDGSACNTKKCHMEDPFNRKVHVLYSQANNKRLKRYYNEKNYYRLAVHHIYDPLQYNKKDCIIQTLHTTPSRTTNTDSILYYTE